MTNIKQLKPPVVLLYQLPDDEVPDYLYPLVIAARMFRNFVVYGDETSDKARALQIIEQVRRELVYAEQRCHSR